MTAHPCMNGKAQTSRSFGNMLGAQGAGREEWAVGLMVRESLHEPERPQAGPEQPSK